VDLFKNLVRILLFVIAIASLAIVGIIGVEFVAQQLQAEPASPESAAASLAQGRPGMEGPEGFLVDLYLRLRQGDLDRPAGDDPSPVNFTVAQGETAVTVAQRLEEGGLVTDGGLFRWYMRYHGIDSRLEAGDYQLAKTMTIPAIALQLQNANLEEVVIRVVEGWRAEQIAEMLSRKGLVSEEEFMSAAKTAQLSYAALADRPPGSSLEGYLFPDTYRIAINSEATDIIDRLASTFNDKFDGDRRAKAAAMGLSVYDALTLASIVEREAVVADERPIIAAVYENRLKQGMYLQADPTVQYALGFQPGTGQWWLLPLPFEALTGTVSIYNTYLNPGLPPGPICNPSLASIDAVLNPADTDYLFFYSKGDGTHAFARTYEEHLRNQELYQQ
jgi:UPF0755 protein